MKITKRIVIGVGIAILAGGTTFSLADSQNGVAVGGRGHPCKGLNLS